MRGMCAACWFVRQTSVRVSALTDTSGATCHGAGSTSAGFWERELLFDLIHDTWAAIHNECFPATYLISWTPAFQVLSLNNMRKIVFFGRWRRKASSCEDVRRIMKCVIPIWGAAVSLLSIVDLSVLAGNAFKALMYWMQQDLNLLIFSSTRQRAMSCVRESRWIQQSFSSRSSCCDMARHWGIWVPTDHLTACACR